MNLVRYLDIKGFPGYRVGDNGSVWSCWTRHSRGYRYGIEYVLSGVWRELTGEISHLGRRRFRLQRNRTGHAFYASRLVLEAFIGECPEGMECCHNNGIKLDNRLENLRWDTKRANLADKIGHGTHNKGVRHNLAKLTDEGVLEARRLRASGLRYKDIASLFGVSGTTVRQAVIGETWSHV